MNAINLALLVLVFSSTALAEDEIKVEEKAEFNVLPQAVNYEMDNTGITDLSDFHPIKYVCQGATPKYKGRVEITATYPITKGMPIDEAAELQKGQMDRVRKYLKNEYFYDIGDRRIIGSGDNYKAFVASVGSLEYAHDLGMFIFTYTFKIPKPVLGKIFGAWDDLDLTGYGYNYHTKAFSAKMALNSQWLLWKRVIASQTTVREAPTTNGIKFSVELDLGLLCAYGIDKRDLISK